MANVNGVSMSPQFFFVSNGEKRKNTTSPLVEKHDLYIKLYSNYKHFQI